jgi:predicted TIM-barrel fold metal-dependent hydrolase
MADFNRRQFLKSSVSAAALSTVSAGSLAHASEQAAVGAGSPPEGQFIDTNVDLFVWPFRTLKYEQTDALVSKLRQHGIRQAWAGSHEAMLHRNIDLVNRRLAEECETKGEGILVPFGTVNPLFPDWEWDLEQCDEMYDMPGIRVYPSYQGFSLGDAEFRRLLFRAAERDMLVQIVVDMEDERLQHPTVPIRSADVSPLLNILPEIPEVDVMLLNAFRQVRGEQFARFINETNVTFDIARLDGSGEIERVLNGREGRVADGQTKVPVERLLLGSHMPFFPLENVLFKFMDSPMTEAQARAILHENAERLIETA